MSQIDRHEKQINGVTYEVKMLPATRGQKLLVRLGQMIGPAMAELTRDGLDAELEGSAFMAAVTALFAHADEHRVDSALKELAEVTLADGRPLKSIYDVHFAGRMGALARWAAFALQAQYSDFFDDLASALDGAGLSERVAGLRSPTASTGESGGS